MTIDWTGSVTARRLEALEQDVALLRDAVANPPPPPPPPPEDPRVGQIVSTLAELTRRLDAAEDRVAANTRMIADQAGSTVSDAERAEMDRAELARLRVSVIRLEREITRHEDETRKIASGLLARIEHGRGLRGVASDADLPGA